MKHILKRAIGLCSYLFYNIFNYESLTYIQRAKSLFYANWIKHSFKNKKGFFIEGDLTLKGAKYISIGINTTVGKHSILTAWEKYNDQSFTPTISIGNDCHFGEYNHITSTNCIMIGDNVLTGRWVTITDNSHGQTDYETLRTPPINREIYSKGSVRIGNNVWIGDKVTILPNVIIGEGAIIAANSVVTKNIPAYSIAGGNPATIIKQHIQESIY